jgi:hypothetical protein
MYMNVLAAFSINEYKYVNVCSSPDSVSNALVLILAGQIDLEPVTGG